jgi:hypothetical protein
MKSILEQLITAKPKESENFPAVIDNELYDLDKLIEDLFTYGVKSKTD